MSESYSFTGVRNHLAALVSRAEAGEVITITRHRIPAAVLAPIPQNRGQSRTIRLSSGTSVALRIDGPIVSLSPGDREWVFDLIDLFKAHEKSLPEDAKENRS